MAVQAFGPTLATSGNGYDTAALSDGRLAIPVLGVGVEIYSAAGVLLSTVPANQGPSPVLPPYQLTALADGGFVVSGASGNSVVFRVYNADLSERTNGAVTVASPGVFNGGLNYGHTVEVLPNGGFVIAFATVQNNVTGEVGYLNGSPTTLINPGSETGIDVRGSIYDASGALVSSPAFLITQGDITFTNYTIYSRFGTQYLSDLDVLPNGDIVPTIYGQRFGTPSGGNAQSTASTPYFYDSFRVINGTTGAAITGETPMNTTAAIGQEISSNFFGPNQTVILSNGTIAGLYSIDTQVTGASQYQAKMQLFSAGGAPIGARVDLALAFSTAFSAPQIRALATDTGGFILAYVTPASAATASTPSTYDIYVREYSGNGTVIGTQQISTGAGYENVYSLSKGPDGTYIVASMANGATQMLTHRFVVTGVGDSSAIGTTSAETLTATGSGRNWLYSGGGADTLVGGAGTNYLYGDAGDSVFTGGSGVNVMRGGAGNETMYGGPQNDTMDGGLGNDTYVVNNAGDSVIERAGGGSDTAYVQANGWTVAANVETVRLSGGATSVTGSAGAEALVANAGAASNVAGGGGDDVLWGGSLAHTLDGGAGDDVIRGQNGAVTMIGGTGNDQFVVGNLGASIVENADAGIDTAYVSVNGWTNFANVEIVRLSAPGAVLLYGSTGNEDLVANQNEASTIDASAGDDTVWGSGLNDVLNGNLGNDIIRGQGGADQFYGGAGNDQFVVFDAASVVNENASEGYDIVYFVGAGSLDIGANVEEARLSVLGTGLVGNASNNLLVGNNAGLASTINAGGGADTVFGTAAGDTITGGLGDDILYSQGGADRFVYDAPGWGTDQIAGFTGGARLQFTAASGVTSFGQLNLNVAGGNTQVNHANGVILVFGATLTASDFVFG